MTSRKSDNKEKGQIVLKTDEQSVDKERNKRTMSDTIASSIDSADYSGIGFERTRSVHFETLKQAQAFVLSKVLGVKNGFRRLVQRESKWESRKKVLEAEAAKQGLMLSDIWVYSDEDSDEEAALEVAKLQYCEERQESFKLVKVWAQDSANQISMFPGYDDEKRKKRALDFIKLMKKHLRSTTPLGEEEEDEDFDWLGREEVSLPPAEIDLRTIKERLRGNERLDSPSVIAHSFGKTDVVTSTPEVAREGKSVKKDGDEGPKSNLGTLIDGQGDEDQAGQASKPEDHEAPPEDHEALGEEGEELCIINAKFNPKHVCEKLPQRKQPEESDDEPEGPDYQKVEKIGKKEVKEEGGEPGEKGVPASQKGDLSMHESILTQHLGRPLTEGLTDTEEWKEYQTALNKMRENKREADEEVERVKAKEEEMRKREEEEEEEKEKKKKEDIEALAIAQEQIQKLDKIHSDRRVMAARRAEQLDQRENDRKEEEKKEKARKKKEEGERKVKREEEDKKAKEKLKIERQEQAAREETRKKKREEEEEKEKRKEEEERERRERKLEEEKREREEEEERRKEEERIEREKQDADRKETKGDEKKNRTPSSSSEDDQEEEEHGRGWQTSQSKRKARKDRKRKREEESSGDNTSSMDTSSSDLDGNQRRGRQAGSRYGSCAMRR